MAKDTERVGSVATPGTGDFDRLLLPGLGILHVLDSCFRCRGRGAVL